MKKMDDYADRVMDLAHQVGDSLRDHLPAPAMRWLETGASVGALRTGGKVLSRAVRRNPTLTVAAVAGAGLLMYAAHRHSKRKAEEDAVDGEARKVSKKRLAHQKNTKSSHAGAQQEQAT